MFAGAGNDKASGNGGSDVIYGGFGNDSLDGGAGNDSLNGEVGNDTLVGGSSADQLYGGAGTDKLIGGTGGDFFLFRGVRDTLKGGARDVIQDFSHAEGDKIDLSVIDANGTVTGNGSFSFQTSKGAAFTGVKGQLHYFQTDAAGTASDRTVIEGDINGDKTADFQIELTGLKTLVSGDFVL